MPKTSQRAQARLDISFILPKPLSSDQISAICLRAASFLPYTLSPVLGVLTSQQLLSEGTTFESAVNEPAPEPPSGDSSSPLGTSSEPTDCPSRRVSDLSWTTVKGSFNDWRRKASQRMAFRP